MNCPKCGTKYEQGAKFCRQCYFRFTDRYQTTQKDSLDLLDIPAKKGPVQNKRGIKIGLRFMFVFGFVVLCIYLLIGFEPFWRLLDRDIVQEYNRRLTETTSILQQHEGLIKKALEVTSTKDPAAASSLAKKYSEKVGQWESTLNQFKLFIETNDSRIRRVGINPDYVRDNIKNTLGIMKENETRFHKEAAQFSEEADRLRIQADELKMQPAKEAIAALQKLEARFLAGISYRDYAPVLGETVHQVRVFLESPGAAEKPELAASIRKVIFHYAMVKEVWDEEVRQWSDGNLRGNPNLMKRLSSSYPEAAKRYIPDYPGLLISRVILKEASEELRKAMSLLQGEIPN